MKFVRYAVLIRPRKDYRWTLECDTFADSTILAIGKYNGPTATINHYEAFAAVGLARCVRCRIEIEDDK